MRLIDADKIGEVSADPYEEGAFQDEIRSQPTVDAITVEWIENYISKMKDDGMIYLSSAGCIKDMLKDWEKENADTD